MGLFSRRAKQEDPRAGAVRLLEDQAAEFWMQVPATFTDGTLFPARPAYDGILALARTLAYSPLPEAGDMMLYCLKVLMGFACVTDPEAHRASEAVEAVSAREILLRAGMVQEERTLSAALLMIFDYHQKAGHEVVMDLDAQGNRI